MSTWITVKIKLKQAVYQTEDAFFRLYLFSGHEYIAMLLSTKHVIWTLSMGGASAFVQYSDKFMHSIVLYPHNNRLTIQYNWEWLSTIEYNAKHKFVSVGQVCPFKQIWNRFYYKNNNNLPLKVSFKHSRPFCPNQQPTLYLLHTFILVCLKGHHEFLGVILWHKQLYKKIHIHILYIGLILLMFTHHTSIFNSEMPHPRAALLVKMYPWRIIDSFNKWAKGKCNLRWSQISINYYFAGTEQWDGGRLWGAQCSAGWN